VKRRDLIVLPLLVSTGWRAGAQPTGKLVRVGYLSGATAGNDAPLLRAFRQGMHELGYREGEHFVIEERYAEERHGIEAQLASELVGSGSDVLLVYGAVAAQAGQRVAAHLPIVITNVADPVGIGLAASLSRPGGNVTGLSDYHFATVTKRLELLKEAVPSASIVGVLYNPDNPHNLNQAKDLVAAAPRAGVTVIPAGASSSGKIEQAFEIMRAARADAVLIVGDTMLSGQQRAIAGLALSAGLPAIYGPRRFAELGGLMSYGADFASMWHRSAHFVDRILKGALPGDLPIEQPTRFELVINQKTAHALGLRLPPQLLARADEVID
jgi:putative tryptophan/tyrosine transport system substrate-binding protein